VSSASPESTNIPPTELASQVDSVSFEAEDGTPFSGKLYGSGSTAVILSNMGDNDPALWDAFAPSLASRGYRVLTYTYRFPTRSSRFDSDMANATLADLNAAITFVREQGAQQIVLVGASLGGMATAKASAAEDPAAVVIIASPMDLSEFDFRVEESELAAITAPKLFISSDNDSVVPFSETQRMFDLSSDPKELLTFPGTAHGVHLFETEHGDDFAQRLIDFIEANAPAEP
jgi:pimeloyl-ACP methyl ester carboxylesterase